MPRRRSRGRSSRAFRRDAPRRSPTSSCPAPSTGSTSLCSPRCYGDDARDRRVPRRARRGQGDEADRLIRRSRLSQLRRRSGVARPRASSRRVIDAGVHQVGASGVDGGEQRGGAADGHRRDAGAHRQLRRGLLAADDRRARRSPRRARPLDGAARRGARRGRPRRGVDRRRRATTATPPRSRRGGTARAGAAGPRAPLRAPRAQTRVGVDVVVAVGARLDELEVVVAEPPEERLGALERARVVEAVERGGRLVDEGAERGEQVDGRSARWPRSGPRRRPSPSRPSDELGRVQHLDREPAPDLHLAEVLGGVGARTTRRRPVAHAVRADLLEQVHRRRHVTRDFDIFLRSGSRTQPLIIAWRHGRTPNSSSLRTTVEKSHVRMISGPWGRRSIGKTRSNRSGSSTQLPAICGVSELVAQVSMTSGSPTNPTGLAALGRRRSRRGRRRTDRRAARSSGGEDRSVVVDGAVVAHGYQTGNGTPK